MAIERGSEAHRGAMAIVAERWTRGVAEGAMAIGRRARRSPWRDGHGACVRSWVVARWPWAHARRSSQRDGGAGGRRAAGAGKGREVRSDAVVLGGAEDVAQDLALDELVLASRRFAERGGGEPVELAQARAGRLVQRGERLGGEELAIAAGTAQPDPDVLGRVAQRGGSDHEPTVDARIERAVLAQAKAVLELGQADEDQRKQGAAVPRVVEQDVQVVEHVLVEQVGLVEEEDGMDVIAPEGLDVGGHGEEEGCGRRGGGEAERRAELAIEVAPAEGCIVAVGQAEARLRQGLAQRPQHARLARTGLADEEHLLVLVDRLAELVDEELLGGRKPQVAVGDLLGEGLFGQAEEAEEGRAVVHVPPPFVLLSGVLPGTRALAGLKSTRRAAFVARGPPRAGLLRRALAIGSTGRSTRRLPSCSTHGGSSGAAKQCAVLTRWPARKPWSSSHALPSMVRTLSPETRRVLRTVSATRRALSSIAPSPAGRLA